MARTILTCTGKVEDTSETRYGFTGIDEDIPQVTVVVKAGSEVTFESDKQYVVEISDAEA